MEDETDVFVSFDLICPECGVGNPRGIKNCVVCDKDLTDTVLFMEDDSFDLEVTREYLLEYRKNFWGTRRTGKTNKYSWDKMEDMEFEEPITRFKFIYEGKQVVIPLRKENMEEMKILYEGYII
ncbi:MAG TPA: hypothetical protein VMC48_02010 [Methanobacterium sp.]|nr:hypothetical protein [Methanobacterium sp.]